MNYDPASPAGQVRLLISDVDPGNYVFSPAEIDSFLDLRDGDVRLAAATALRTVAGNATMVRGRLTMLDGRTDGPAEGRALLELADRLEAEVDEAGRIDVTG